MREHQGRKFTRWSALLIITVPIAAFGSFWLYVIAAVSLCGVSGCGGGGFGVAYGPDYEWIVPLVVAGLLMTVAVAGPPWWLPSRRRWIVVGTVFAALVVIATVLFADSKYGWF